MLAHSSVWRLILDAPAGGAYNMAVDEALLEAAAVDRNFTPTLRVYGFERPVLTIGYAQDAAIFEGKGIEVARRPTGGRAVLHGAWEAEVTYAVVCNDAHRLHSLGIQGAYRVICEALVSALKSLGVEAEGVREKKKAKEGLGESCFHAASFFEISVAGRKLVGSAQRRIKGAFLQHGSIIMSVDTLLFDAVFGPGSSAEVGSVLEFSRASRADVAAALVKGFEKELGAGFCAGSLLDKEKMIVERVLSGAAAVCCRNTDVVGFGA